jgi:hypothetical protein
VDPGDRVLLRSIYRGRVRWTWPHHFVGTHETGRVGIYVQPGTRGKLMKRALRSGYLEAWARGDPPIDDVWERSRVLRFMREGDAHTIELFWDEAWSFLGRYVNLQAPLRVHRADTARSQLRCEDAGPGEVVIGHCSQPRLSASGARCSVRRGVV